MWCAARRFATFKHEKPGGWGNVNFGKTVSNDGDAHVLCFIYFLFTTITHYTGENWLEVQ